ncbi:MAG: MBOAT family O-acyltransferase [Planctomycetaceae bacterium]
MPSTNAIARPERNAVLFNSPEFAIFLVVVLAAYYALSSRAQNVLLVVASYFFYGWWDWRFCLLLAFSTVLDFTCALKIEGSLEQQRKWWLWLSVCGNLGVLGFFKYYDFFVTSAFQALSFWGLEPNPPLLKVILPVGISFYTFQTMAYTIDVYRRKMEPTRDFILMALYVSYFPQLVAGPIERAQHMFKQFARARHVEERRLLTGGFLILLGLFKKLAIADAVAPRVNEIYLVSGEASWLTLLEGAWLFSLQIYGDFSGYSDIARGVSRLLGIELMVNFRQPYLSQSITEFWRRWHISLSTWLRDYLYIPLGGNRLGPVRTYVNLIITMLLGPVARSKLDVSPVGDVQWLLSGLA